jgi:hypothetical protein
MPARGLEESRRRRLRGFIVRIGENPVGSAPSIAGRYRRCRIKVVVVITTHDRGKTLFIDYPRWRERPLG